MEMRMYDDETVSNYATRVIEEWLKARSQDEARDILRAAEANLDDDTREQLGEAIFNILNGACPEDEKAKALRASFRAAAGCQSG